MPRRSATLAACELAFFTPDTPHQPLLSDDGRIGVALNGTSSVLYGSVPGLVAPERRARAFSVFYTGTIGAGAIAPTIYGVAGDALGMATALIVVAAVVLLTLPLSLVLKPALAPHPA